MADGKYLSLDDLKLYGLGAIADPNNPTVYNDAVQGTPDDPILSQCIQRAEMEFDRHCGVQFNSGTLTDTQAFIPFVDGQGWLHLFARERCPVTAVTAVSIRDLVTRSAWSPVTLTTDDVILPLSDGYAHPDSSHVKLYPNPVLPSRSTGQILARWTYTGGFATIPDSLKAIVARLSWWIYKLREAPMAKIAMPQMGIMEIPIRIPPDIAADINLWKPDYA